MSEITIHHSPKGVECNVSGSYKCPLKTESGDCTHQEAKDGSGKNPKCLVPQVVRVKTKTTT